MTQGQEPAHTSPPVSASAESKDQGTAGSRMLGWVKTQGGNAGTGEGIKIQGKGKNREETEVNGWIAARDSKREPQWLWGQVEASNIWG